MKYTVGGVLSASFCTGVSGVDSCVVEGDCVEDSDCAADAVVGSFAVVGSCGLPVLHAVAVTVKDSKSKVKSMDEIRFAFVCMWGSSVGGVRGTVLRGVTGTVLVTTFLDSVTGTVLVTTFGNTMITSMKTTVKLPY